MLKLFRPFWYTFAFFFSLYCFADAEGRRLEEETRGKTVLPEREKPAITTIDLPLSPAPPPTPPQLLKPPVNPDVKISIKNIRVSGDPVDLERFQSLMSTEIPSITLETKLREDCVGKELSREEIRQVALRYTTGELIAQNYLLAFIVPDYNISDDGTLVFRISFGRIDQYKFGDDTNFERRYFGERQIRRHLTLREGEIFDYSTFYDDIYGLNIKPDLAVDADVKVYTDPRTESRFAKITLTPTESMPLHGTISTSNYGTNATDRRRTELSVSYDNLTLHNDSLRFNYVRGPERELYQAISGSYTLPLDTREKLTLHLFGGKSDTDIRDIAPLLDVVGDERFIGLQLTYRFIETRKTQWSFAAGRVWRSTSDFNRLGGAVFNSRELDSAPIDLNVDFHNKVPDRVGGYNSFSVSWILNRQNLGGSSSANEFLANGPFDDDYAVFRGRYTRYQPLGVNGAAISIRIDSQDSNDRLISSEQLSAGGIFSIRGYKEDELLSDIGVNATVEVLSPELSVDLTKHSRFAPGTFTLQILSFFDYAYGRLNTLLAGEQREDELKSVGFGARVVMAKYFGVDFDYGWPLEPTEPSNSSGRAHLIVRLEF